jgi:hypothetical protein
VRINRGAGWAVKHLYDSEYVKPEDNRRVVQDSNPVKAAILDDARNRFEKTLDLKSALNTKFNFYHSEKINKDQDDINREKTHSSNMKVQFKKNLEDQIFQNVSKILGLINFAL